VTRPTPVTLDQAPPHPLGPRLAAEVDEFVAALRGSSPAPIDIDVVARRVSVDLVWRDLGDALLGLTLASGRVLLHVGSLGERRGAANYVFAHELAHVLHRRGHFASVAREDEEWFADWFARELVLPRRWLPGRAPSSLAADLLVSFDVVGPQLAVIGYAPPLMRHGKRVLCRTCGARAHRTNCMCVSWRGSTGRDIDTLADVHALDTTRPPDHHATQLALIDAGPISTTPYKRLRPTERAHPIPQLDLSYGTR
jgi:hypothetical protein